MAEDNVLFRVTRPNTSIFHPDRAVSLLPVHTGGEIELPESVAAYHVRNGVGEVVTKGEKKAEEPQDGPQASEEPKAPARRPGRPAKAAE